MAGRLYNVGIVARITARDIVHNIRVEYGRFTMLRRYIPLVMLDKLFIVFM